MRSRKTITPPNTHTQKNLLFHRMGKKDLHVSNFGNKIHNSKRDQQWRFNRDRDWKNLLTRLPILAKKICLS